MDHSETYHRHLKRTVLLPIYLTIFLFLLISLYSLNLFKTWQERYEIRHQADGIQHLFAEFLKSETSLLAAQLDHYENDQTLQDFFQSKNRGALLSSVLPTFTEQLNKYQITHLYFNDLEGHTFLRVHNPDQYGDPRINAVFKESFKDRQEHSGIALGRFGTFTLRLVRPWYNQKGLAGYLEIGKEIDHITPKLKKISGADILLLIDKHLVNRTDWEEGRKMMGNQANWNSLTDHLLIDQTMEQVPDALYEHLEKIHEEDGITYFSFTDESGDNFQSSIIPLPDATGNRVGQIVLLNASSYRDEQASDLAANILLFVIFASLLLSVAFYLFLSKIQKQLSDAEKFMENSKTILTMKVLERTRELESANRDLEMANSELEKAIANIRTLQTFLPICSSCKKIRNDEGYWSQVEEYIHQHTGVEFTHGICPDCAEQLYPGFYKK